MNKIFFLLAGLAMLGFLFLGSASAEKPHELTTYIAHLSGDAAGVDTLAQGQAIFHVSKDGESVTYRLIAANTENITMAHIHIAEVPGGDGAVAVWLYPMSPPPQLIPGRFSGNLAMGTFTAGSFVAPFEGMTIDDLENAIAEGRAYVNVHTSQFPAGEIRGDIQ